MGIKKCTFTKAYTISLVHKNCRSHNFTQFELRPPMIRLTQRTRTERKTVFSWRILYMADVSLLRSHLHIFNTRWCCQHEDFSQALFIASARRAPRKPQESSNFLATGFILLRNPWFLILSVKEFYMQHFNKVFFHTSWVCARSYVCYNTTAAAALEDDAVTALVVLVAP